MSGLHDFDERERLGLRFLIALQLGDLDALEELWGRAVSSVDLEMTFSELSRAFLERETNGDSKPTVELHQGGEAVHSVTPVQVVSEVRQAQSNRRCPGAQGAVESYESGR